ncbi:hypothetical protein R0381_002576 [Jeongeupia wiesaeckerbachi]|uniref:hypothetical protein n=1 Tax=Jeongeupia wiesaeckerbachi TaxID=3051218 RepID=UPI003D804503
MSEYQMHRDPVFDAVARREANERRRQDWLAKQAANDAIWRASPEYRQMRRRKVQQAMRKVSVL